MPDRLFVPLNKEWFDLFVEGRKEWEIRAISPRFNEKTVVVGRAVELRRGYQKKGAIWGTITDYRITDSIFDLPDEILHKAVPRVKSIAMMAEIQEYDRKYPSFITFRIQLSTNLRTLEPSHVIKVPGGVALSKTKRK